MQVFGSGQNLAAGFVYAWGGGWLGEEGYGVCERVLQGVGEYYVMRKLTVYVLHETLWE